MYSKILPPLQILLIGRLSSILVAKGTLSIGVMFAIFHCFGNIDLVKHELKIIK